MHHQEFPKIVQKLKVCNEISLNQKEKKGISWQGKEKENLLKRRRRKKKPTEIQNNKLHEKNHYKPA